MATANQWPTAEAKAKFSEVMDEAEKHGPQTILKNGKRKAIVVSPEEWDRLAKPKQSLGHALLNGPWRGSGIRIERISGKVRPVQF